MLHSIIFPCDDSCWYREYINVYEGLITSSDSNKITNLDKMMELEPLLSYAM